MGDNATKNWDWHNVEVGKGYQANGVMRQPMVKPDKSLIVDMREPISKTVSICRDVESSVMDNNEFAPSRKKSKKQKMESKDRKEHKKSKKHQSKSSSHSNKSETSFNPFLQVFALRLSNKTTAFSV